MNAAGITSSSPLLSLSPAIRRQICLESGVCTGQIIYLSVRAIHPYRYAGPIDLLRLVRREFYTLLFVCRTMYAELSHIIYSENTVIVRKSSQEAGFQAVRNLTALSTSALRSLTVYLNGAQCWLNGCCGGYKVEWQLSCEDRGRKESLTNSVPIDQTVLNDW